MRLQVKVIDNARAGSGKRSASKGRLHLKLQKFVYFKA